MESVREAEKNRALFEAICMSVMTQRDLQQLMDRARYDEDEEYWIIPYVKLANSDVPMVQRSMEYGSAVGGGQYGYSNESAPQFQQQLHPSYSEISPRGQPQRSSASSAHHSAGANAAFPGLSSNSTASSRRNSRENDTSMRKAHSGGRSAYVADTGDSDNCNYHNDQNYEDGLTNYGKGGGGIDMSSCGVLPSQLNQNNNVASLPAVGKGARNVSAGVMPLLGAGATRASDAQQNDYEYYCGDGQDTAGPPKKKLSGTYVHLHRNIYILNLHKTLSFASQDTR
jgi:hypothetical protein